MDEVKTMARAGEQVGKVVGTGVRSARHGARLAGQAGTGRSRQGGRRPRPDLALRDLSPEEFQERLLRKTVGMSRKELRQWQQDLRKQLAKNTEAARYDLAARITPAPPKRRRWPWILLITLGLGIAVAVVLSRRPEQLPVAEAEQDADIPSEEFER